ncbi:hypothetical protein WN944_001935 [Citrus x changshan-huyou]|uniref:Uncharacterized protein n=1 Tax=Citrus x changshan-huyou TaxID=2935761 RepID=A0AAP0MI73_9ROSI
MSNELGTGNIGRDKNAMAVAIEHSVILALIVVWAIAFGHDIWAGFFRLARGYGEQHLAVLANLGTFYFIGMPIAAVLGFKVKLYAQGIFRC